MANTDTSNIDQIITQIATELAGQYKVNASELVEIALATMNQESGGNPQAVGDNGTSFGLFQLQEGGELGGLSQQQAFNPTTNATVALTEMAKVLAGNPNASPGEVAAMAQRPADPAGYAASINNAINGGGGGTGSVATGGAGPSMDAAGNPSPPPIADINALQNYVRQYFPDDAWLLNIPQVGQVIEQAVAQGDDAQQVQARLQQTQWYKTTSDAYRSYLNLAATNPAAVNPNIPGSQAGQQLADVKALAAQIGVNLSAASASGMALNALKYGWDQNQLRAAIGDTVYYKGAGAGQTDAGAVITQLQSAAAQYLLPVSAPVLQSWAQNIAAGTQTIDQFDAYLKQSASTKWTGMAPQIQQGLTPNQIVDSLRQNVAQTMEVDPNSINFVTDPTYSKLLDYVPPNSPNGVHRLMTQSEADQYLKTTPTWGGTQQARDQVGSLADTIISTFGKTG